MKEEIQWVIAELIQVILKYGLVIAAGVAIYLIARNLITITWSYQ